jgi:hypothetical protein
MSSPSRFNAAGNLQFPIVNSPLRSAKRSAFALGGVGFTVLLVAVVLYVFRLDPCRELDRIELEETWAKKSGRAALAPRRG